MLYNGRLNHLLFYLHTMLYYSRIEVQKSVDIQHKEKAQAANGE